MEREHTPLTRAMLPPPPCSRAGEGVFDTIPIEEDYTVGDMKLWLKHHKGAPHSSELARHDTHSLTPPSRPCAPPTPVISVQVRILQSTISWAQRRCGSKAAAQRCSATKRYATACLLLNLHARFPTECPGASLMRGPRGGLKRMQRDLHLPSTSLCMYSSTCTRLHVLACMYSPACTRLHVLICMYASAGHLGGDGPSL